MVKQTQDKRFASTLARGLSVLRAFRPSDNGLGNLEISQRTGIPRSTVSRLTFTLCAERYLTQGRHHEKYHLGPAAFALGNIASATFRFVDTAAPIMQSLADQTGNLAGVAIYDNGEMLMVKTWRPANPPTVWLDVGYRMPVLGSSTGAAYLGALNSEEMARVTSGLDDTRTESYRAMSQDAREDLMAKGFTHVSGSRRYTQTISAAAAPFRTTEFAEPVSFMCSAESARLTEEMLETSAGPALASAVQDLQRLSGLTVSPVAGP